MNKMTEENLLPSINYFKRTNNYTAYIPYKSNEPDINEVACNSSRIAMYLDLPWDRSNYNPSYVSFLGDKKEIGITGPDIGEIFNSIKNIQTRLEGKNCIVNNNLENIQIIIIDENLA